MAAFNLQADVKHAQEDQSRIWYIASSMFIFVSWLYASVLALLSRRYQLPNAWGWILNVHLCIIYFVAWFVSLYQLWQVVLIQSPNISWLDCLPFLLPVLLGFDLIYVTSTTKQGPPFLDENDRQVCNINVESIIGYLYLNWCSNIVSVVAKKKADLMDEDLPVMTAQFRAHNIFYTFGATRGKELISRLITANKPKIIIQFSLSVVASALYYAPAFFMNRLLQFLQDYNAGVSFDHPMQYAILIVIGMGVSIVVMGIFVSQQWYFASCALQSSVRSMLNVEVYRKSLRRRDLSVAVAEKSEEEASKNEDKDEAAASSTGAIVNLMGTDASRVADFSSIWFILISAPLELCVGIYFLYQLLGVSCFYGLLVMIFILPINHFNAQIFAKTQDRLMEARDKRVTLMNEVLQGIRQIKFFAWESNWEKRIMEARSKELHHLSITYINGVFFSLVWQGAPILVTLISFYSFTVIEGKELTAPIAFTVISVFSELRVALNVIPEIFMEGIQAYASVKRIRKFLNEDEIEVIVPQDPRAPVDISFQNATVGWKKPSEVKQNTEGEEEEASFVLVDINAKFPNGELSLISGSTGSGKTLMLLSLLGETILIDGKVSCPRTPVSDTITSEIGLVSADIHADDWVLEHSLAYVSQTPWLQNASIRTNILFGLPYIESRYKDTLTACALDKDLSIFEDGDRTEIGEKGITLSGGQKARVALARAVYSRAQNILMDDVLSAVDSHTAKHLYESCLMGPLMKNRTRILVTHHVKLCIKGSAFLVHIEGGGARHVGSPTELRQSGQLAHIIEENNEVDEDDVNKREEIELVGSSSSKTSTVVDTSGDTQPKKDEKAARVLIEEESRASGSVKMRLYRAYFSMVGHTGFWIVMTVIMFGARGFEISESWWIKTWAQAYDHYSYENDQANNTAYTFATILGSRSSYTNFMAPASNQLLSDPISANAFDQPTHKSPSDGVIHLNYYLGVYCLITISNVIIGSLRFAYLYWGALRANKKLYSDLLHRVFRAPLRFFDTTPLGRILNRFSKDFESVDSKIPTDLMNFVIQWILIVTSAITVCIVLPMFTLPMVVVAIANVIIGMNYISSSRELKRLDSVTRSPVFSTFTETISGVATIRAFGATQQFLQTMMECIDENVRPFFYSWCVNRWVSIRYSLTSAVINFAACAFALYNIGTLDVSLAGFGLSFVLMFADNMFWGIRQYTGVEMSFNSVERIIEFMEMDQEAPTITDLRPPPQWPTQGQIEVRDLEVKYAADLDPVLKGLTFSVKPQEKIGVVGRTGSGKSTLALSFFRFVEASAGSILIDNINIKDLGTEDLRSNLTIIPQDPTLFSGSLRSNMDPFDQFQDEDIFAAFCRVELIRGSTNNSATDNILDGQEVNANVFNDLNTLVSEGGKNFSQGQRQLLCMARALLKRSRIVLMDEATASVDFETDKAIQKTIATEFSDSTILCIAHRLHTVIEYDRILVLDHGEIQEFDNPLTLISNPESSFYKMCRNSGEFESLVELAKSKHQSSNI